MRSMLACPFCRLREPAVAEDGASAFRGAGDEEAYECACGAVAFRSPDLQRRVRQEQADALEHVRACVGTSGRVPLEMKWNTILESEPPIRLLWVRKGAAASAPPAPARPPAEAARPAAPTKVLCIDDDRLILHLLETTLNRHGLIALTAPDGPTGIAMAQSEQPQLILVDIMMPEMDGFEVCRRLKADPRTNAIPLIILTARTDPKLNIQAFRVGADLALTKPIQPEKLVATLRAALALKQTGS